VLPRSVEPKLNGQMRRYIAAMLGSQITAEDRKHIAQQFIKITPAGSGIGDMRANYQDGLRLLMGAAGLLLLIACANIANLLLARSAASRVQNSVRAAIGAGRLRLLAQALTESVLLALLGGAAGIAVAFAGMRAILLLAFHGARYVPIDATPSPAMLGFALLASLFTGVLFGAVPAWIGSRSDPAEALRGASRSTDRSSLPRRLLVVFQMALALALLASAGLLTRSLLALEHQEFGFQTSGRLMVNINPRLTNYSPEKIGSVYRQLRERLAALPGVLDVSFSLYSPMEYTNWEGPIVVEGHPVAPANNPDTASWDRVAPRYFETIGTPVLRGRGISEEDTPGSRRVAVVNEMFVRKFFGNVDPIGRHFGWTGGPTDPEYEVAGVVRDAKYVDADQPPHQMFFLPLLQMSKEEWKNNGMARSNVIGDIELRVGGRQGGVEQLVRHTLAEIDPDMTVLEIRSFDDQLALNFNRERLVSNLTLLFALLSLVVACVGLYGVTAYSVAQRTAEIGIRMAFGAAQTDVLAMVIRRAALQVVVGALIGLPLALAFGRLLRSRLYQVGAFDPMVLTAATMLLAGCALAAAFFPARRASALNPVQALRCE
jgi:predicted permease